VKGARSWVFIAALASFAAGASIGLLIPHLAYGGEAPAGEREQYVCRLAADLGLTASQERSIRLIMQNQLEQEIAVWQSASPDQLPPPTQNKLLKLRYQTEQRIRVVLDAQQRERYDLESRPMPNVGFGHGAPSAEPTTRR
jgi:hypothetical protein